MMSPADARSLAVLIGVSNYEDAGYPKLKGPANDVRLVWDALRARGFARDDIVVLADEMSEGADSPAQRMRPTAAAILTELDQLAERARQGDLLVVYFSGHGTIARQSRLEPGDIEEPSGNNQVLLAINAGKFNTNTGEITGGIVDKVLRRKFDALKRKATLWLILDACHSGGFTREEGTGVGVHFVDPTVTRAPVASWDAEHENRIPYRNPWIDDQAAGKQIAFLAAPESYPAYERETGSDGRTFSQFTHTVMTTLSAENFASYRQLASAVARAQAGLPGHLPSPVFEGDLDQPMFDGAAPGPRSWVAEAGANSGTITVEAGELQGLHVGAILALSRAGNRIGFCEVVKAGASVSEARVIKFGGVEMPGPAQLSGRLSASIVRSSVSFVLRVARPPSADAAAHGADRALAAIDHLARQSKSELPIEWKPASSHGSDVHLRLRIADGLLYFLPPTGEFVKRGGRRTTPAIKIGSDVEATQTALQHELWLVLRQQNLRRIAAEMRDTGLGGAVDVRLYLVRNTAELGRLRKDERQPCSFPDIRDQVKRPIPTDRPVTQQLTHCDRIQVQIVNHWPTTVDATLLYLDSEGGIIALGERRIEPLASNSLPEPVGTIEIVTWCDKKRWSRCVGQTGTSEYMPVGTERLMAIIAAVDTPSAPQRTFQYLAQPSQAHARNEMEKPHTRSQADSFDELLRTAGLSLSQTRGEIERAGDATIKMFAFNVVPPVELRDDQ